jgi:DNA-binding protein HU-beta
MNKTDLINAIAANSGLSKKDSEKALTATIDVITNALAEGDKVQLVGFGIFDIKDRAARIGRNPKTKEPIDIPATRTPLW